MCYMYYRFHVNRTGSLIVLDLQESNKGTYKAVATNGAGSVEVSATLNIYYCETTVYIRT